jgi:hypothetical protein
MDKLRVMIISLSLTHHCVVIIFQYSLINSLKCDKIEIKRKYKSVIINNNSNNDKQCYDLRNELTNSQLDMEVSNHTSYRRGVLWSWQLRGLLPLPNKVYQNVRKEVVRLH